MQNSSYDRRGAEARRGAGCRQPGQKNKLNKFYDYGDDII